jgi:hypothetical protein
MEFIDWRFPPGGLPKALLDKKPLILGQSGVKALLSSLLTSQDQFKEGMR